MCFYLTALFLVFRKSGFVHGDVLTIIQMVNTWLDSWLHMDTKLQVTVWVSPIIQSFWGECSELSSCHQMFSILIKLKKSFKIPFWSEVEEVKCFPGIKQNYRTGGFRMVRLSWQGRCQIDVIQCLFLTFYLLHCIEKFS